MLPLHLLSLTLTLLTSSTAALPTSGHSSSEPAAKTETWRIPRLELHMMTRLSGLPGGGDWPASFQYPSTIDFDIVMPNNQSLHCHNEFANGTLPVDSAPCAGEGTVGFRMAEYTELGPRRKELSFVLHVFRVENGTLAAGEVAVTANDPNEPSSYLTCLLGAPFDGLRCKLHGGLSVHKELQIVARRLMGTNASEQKIASYSIAG